MSWTRKNCSANSRHQGLPLEIRRAALNRREDGFWDLRLIGDGGVAAEGSLKSLFNSWIKLEKADLKLLDTGNVADMSFMFNYCPSLTSLDVSGWDTGNVTAMALMFRDCHRLTRVPIVTEGATSFARLTKMSKMFHSCYDLKSVDLGSWMIPALSDMSEMFYDCGTHNSRLSISLRWAGMTGTTMNTSNIITNCSGRRVTLAISTGDTSQYNNIVNTFRSILGSNLTVTNAVSAAAAQAAQASTACMGVLNAGRTAMSIGVQSPVPSYAADFEDQNIDPAADYEEPDTEYSVDQAGDADIMESAYAGETYSGIQRRVRYAGD